MELVLINKELRDRVVIKPGFDWWSFLSFLIYGFPHLLRKQYDLSIWAASVSLIISLEAFFYDFEDTAAYAAIMLVFIAAQMIFLGLVGKKLFCKNLISRGYDFEDENSTVVIEYKRKWNVL